MYMRSAREIRASILVTMITAVDFHEILTGADLGYTQGCQSDDSVTKSGVRFLFGDYPRYGCFPLKIVTNWTS